MPADAGNGHARRRLWRRHHAATILQVSPEESEAEPGPAGTSGPPAESAGQLLAPAAPQAAPRSAASQADASTVRAGRAPSRTRSRVLGWLLGTGFVFGLAWLLTSLITSWTTYPTLTVTTWSTLTYGPRSAQIYFVVTNTGTGAATGCQAHLQLGNGQVVTMSWPTVAVNGTKRNYLKYTEAGGAHRRASYLWADCDGAQSPRKQVATVSSIALVTSGARVSRAGAGTTVTFRLRNLGSQSAIRCRAFARLSDLTAAGDTATTALRGHSATAFTVTFKGGKHSRPGLPFVAWAQCLDPAASGGFVTSSRSYITSPLSRRPA
jgi:hypothetical protein